MVKHSKHKKLQEAKPKYISRRQFVTTSAVLAVGLIGISAYEVFWDKHLGKEYYERRDKKPENLPVVELERELKNNEITQEDINILLQEVNKYSLSRKLKDLTNSQALWNPEDIKINKYRTIWVTFEPDIKYAQRITDLSKGNLDDALNFWNNSFLIKSNYIFRIPRTKEDIQLNDITKEQQIIYVVYMAGESDVAIADVKYRNFDIEFKNSKQKSHVGFNDREIEMTIGMNNLELRIKKYKPIFFSLNSSPINLLITPAMEMLHHQLSEYTIQHIEKELNKLQNPDGSLNLEKKREADAKWMYREELLVHSLGKLWFEAYNKENNIGFTEQEIEAHRYSVADKYVRPFSKYLKSLGIKKAIDVWVNEPEKLFIGYAV